MEKKSFNTDVVRLLLQRAVELHRPNALNLLLLSKWVRDVVEPVLYRTVVLDQLLTLGLFARTIHMRPDLGKHVRRLRVGNLRSSLFGPAVMTGIPLSIGDTWDVVRAVLALCVNVQHFAFWAEECNGGLVSLFRCQCGGELVQLKRLSVKIDYQTADVIDMLPRGSSLTHLHIDFFMDKDIARLRWPDVFERGHELTHILVLIARGDVKTFTLTRRCSSGHDSGSRAQSSDIHGPEDDRRVLDSAS